MQSMCKFHFPGTGDGGLQKVCAQSQASIGTDSDAAILTCARREAQSSVQIYHAHANIARGEATYYQAGGWRQGAASNQSN